MKIFKFVFLILFIIFMYIFTKIYLNMESPLYTCDLSEYNLSFIDYSKLIYSDFKSFISSFASEIYNLNRNPFLNIFFFPFYPFFKESRYGYIMAINLVFMMPVMILLFKLINCGLVNNTSGKIEFNSKAVEILFSISAAFVIFLSPSLWHPSLKAIPDICGMIPVLFAFILYLKYGFDKKIPVKIILLTAFLLYFSFLLRRWYSVVILSFLISVVIQNLIESIINIIKSRYGEQINDLNSLKDVIHKTLFSSLNIFIFIFIVGILALLFQFGYVSHSIFNEIHERSMFIVQYNQWRIILFHHVGLLFLVFAILGIVLGFKYRLARFAFLNLFIYLSLYILLMNNQFIWINHNIFPACMIIILTCIGIYSFINLIKVNVINSVVLLLIIIYSCFNIMVFFMPINTFGFYRIFPYTTSYPEKTDNFNQIQDMCSYLENEYAKNKNIKLAIYGLNRWVGYWQFRSLNPASEFAKNNVLFETIDDREFKGNEINADFVLVVNPLGLYFDDDSVCRVLTYTQQMFLQGNGIAKNYSLVKEFNLDDKDNSKVMLFKRNKPLSEKQIKKYLQHFYQYYPEWENSDFVNNTGKNE